MTFALLAGAALWASASTPFVQNLQKAQTRAEADERIEYYGRAIKTWEPADSMPLLGQAHFGRGEGLVERWRFEEALADLDKAVELDPGNARAYLLRGRARARLGRSSEALADLIEHAGRNPTDVEGLVELSAAQLKVGRGDAALKTCRMAQQADAEDFRGFLCEGRALMARKDWAAADRALSTADRVAKSRSGDALAERGVCRVALGRHEDALKDYTGAVEAFDADVEGQPRSTPEPAKAELRDRSARVLFGRGRVNEFLSHPDQALGDYLRACELGHKQACARAAALSPSVEVKPEPERKPKKRRAPAPESDPGDRIYGG